MQEPSLTISVETMQKLGLNPETVTKVQSQRAQINQAVNVCRNNGAEVYARLSQYPELSLSSINLSTQNLTISPINTPGQLLDAIKAKLPELITSGQIREIEPQLKAFLDGYGYAALDRNDLEVAVTCLDFASDKGLLNNDEALSKIKQMTGNNPEQLVIVAEIIERLKLNQGDSATNPVTVDTQIVPRQVPISQTPPPQAPAQNLAGSITNNQAVSQPVQPQVAATPPPPPTTNQSPQAQPPGGSDQTYVSASYQGNGQTLRPVPPKPPDHL